MDLTVVKKGNRFHVFERGADKMPSGESLANFATNAEAEAHMAKLMKDEKREGLLQEIWTKLREFFTGPSGEGDEVERVIKDVASWDGSAAQWADAGSYCQDCLIDCHPAAGKTEKTKALCMLPIRGPDDPNTTYVRQAAHACAGGRGISRLVKPTDVSDADWLKLVKAAAKKLISIYGQMKETPPDSMYVAAGEQVPTRERAVSWEQIGSEVIHELNDQGYWLNDLYEDNGKIIAIVSAGGKLYRAPVMVMGTDVTLGELAEVEVQFAQVPGAPPPEPPMQDMLAEGGATAPMMQGRVRIVRQVDGHHRWFAIAATSVLNRCGEIDSQQLFDSFVENFKGLPVTDNTEGSVALRFYHIKGLDFGWADWLAREEYALLASGTLNEEHPIARALIQDAADGHSGVTWGVSIGYKPLVPPQEVEVAEGITIPVYTAGRLDEISLLPESRAANWFTTYGLEVQRMNTERREALLKLLNDEKALAEFEKQVDGTNRSIDDKGLVTRDTVAAEGVEGVTGGPGTPGVVGPAVTEATPVAVVAEAVVEAKPADNAVIAEAMPDTKTDAPSPQEPAQIVLDAATMAEIAKLVAANLKPPEVDPQAAAQAWQKSLDAAFAPFRADLAALTQQVAGLQRTADGKEQIRQADMPARREIVVTHRPKEANATSGPAGEPTMQDRANRTNEQLSQRVKPVQTQ